MHWYKNEAHLISKPEETMETEDKTPQETVIASPKKDSSTSSEFFSSFTGLGLRFDTKYNEQTGLLSAFNLGLERFQPGQGDDKYYTRSDAVPKPDDESGWEGQQDDTLGITDGGDVRTWPPGTVVHVVFHFHDNSS